MDQDPKKHYNAQDRPDRNNPYASLAQYANRLELELAKLCDSHAKLRQVETNVYLTGTQMTRVANEARTGADIQAWEGKF